MPSPGPDDARRHDRCWVLAAVVAEGGRPLVRELRRGHPVLRGFAWCPQGIFGLDTPEATGG